MTDRAYYNEHDPFAAAWLRNLISAGLIAPGDVDERSIEDVVPLELAKYTQCHFFAGIGVWSYALRSASVSDTAQVWTGSCPCQPFSSAGKGSGFDDERHLWPAFHHLISERRPRVVLGEQVASKDGLAWLDLVQADLEGSGYASAALDMCSAGFGAPHIRQRLYWVAKPDDAQRGPNPAGGDECDGENARRSQGAGHVEGCGGVGALDHAADPRCNDAGQHDGRSPLFASRSVQPSDACHLADAPVPDQQRYGGNTRSEAGEGCGETRSPNGNADRGASGLVPEQPGATNGFWRDADWIFCRDGKWRPVEPGTFPLAHGVANRVGLLRGYGNAIVAPQAEEFIKVAMEYAP